MEEQKATSFTEGMRGTESVADAQQNQCFRRTDLPGERKGSEEKKEAGRGEDIPAMGLPRTIQVPDFQRDLCIYPMDFTEFREQYDWSDYLVIGPGKRVQGKGLKDTLRACQIYISHGNDRYTFNLGEDGDNKDIFYGIPKNLEFVIIGKGEEVFAVITEYNGEISVYRLGDDVNMSIYFETGLYKGRFNLFYGYIEREPRYSFYSCGITGNPYTGEIFFRSFARTVNFGRKEILA